MRQVTILAATLFMVVTPPLTVSAGDVATPSAIIGTAITPTNTPTNTPTKVKTREKSVDKPRAKTETFKVTAYCPCEECSCGYGRQTATGHTARSGHTVAVDPTVIPYGTHVKINGVEYIAEDCGSAVKGNTIDVFFDSHEETEQFGVQYLEVEVMK